MTGPGAPMLPYDDGDLRERHADLTRWIASRADAHPDEVARQLANADALIEAVVCLASALRARGPLDA